MVEINRNLTWQDTKVTRHDRSEMNQHESFCLWFTGLSGSGKSTIATAVERSLHLQGIRTYLLDGDNVRHGLCSDLGFSAEDRKENIRRIAQVAGLMVDGGSVVIVAAISPNQQDRQMAREVFQNNDFVEIFVDCPVD
ncbi:MAG: adenylyl-sulfate kinase, partial [Alicyclobacillus sp. RIFOXYA1_FULL_53_8]